MRADEPDEEQIEEQLAGKREEGAVVLKDFNRKKRRGGKLDKCWEGPYVITAS